MEVNADMDEAERPTHCTIEDERHAEVSAYIKGEPFDKQWHEESLRMHREVEGCARRANMCVRKRKENIT